MAYALAQGQSIENVANVVGRSKSTVTSFVNEMRGAIRAISTENTTRVAQRYVVEHLGGTYA